MTGLRLRGLRRGHGPHWSVAVARILAVGKVLVDRFARVVVDLPVTPPVCDRGRCSLGRRCHFSTVAPLDADMAPGPASQ